MSKMDSYASVHVDTIPCDVPCALCEEMVPRMDIYRCYDCDKSFHKECLISHCKESRLDGERIAKKMSDFLQKLQEGGSLISVPKKSPLITKKIRCSDRLMYDLYSNAYIIILDEKERYEDSSQLELFES